MARRTPVRIWAVMPGSTTRSTVSVRVADRLRASSSQLRSSWATPAAVLSRMGQTAAKASRKYTGASPTPSTITAMGIHDSGEIMRRNWNTGENACENPRDRPTSTPSGTPTTKASSRPTATRCRLSRVCIQMSAPVSSWPSACSEGQGAKAAATGVLRASSAPPTHHRARTRAAPSSGNPIRRNTWITPRWFRGARNRPECRRPAGRPRPGWPCARSGRPPGRWPQTWAPACRGSACRPRPWWP